MISTITIKQDVTISRIIIKFKRLTTTFELVVFNFDL